MEMAMSNMLLTVSEAAEYLRLSHRTLDGWRWKGTGPAYQKLGSSIRYRKAALDAFVEEGGR